MTLILFLLLSLLLACTRTAQPPEDEPGMARPIAEREAGGLKLSLKLDKPSYSLGEPMTLTFTVTNVSQAAFQHNLRTSQVYDFLVRKDGKEVWRWSVDKGFLQVITEFTLAPGQSRAYQETWNQVDNRGKPVAVGEYRFVGVLKTLPERSSAVATAQVR